MNLEMPASFDAWVGRSEESADRLAEAPVRLLQATLDYPDASTLPATLPPLWHWLYFLPGERPPEPASAPTDAQFGHTVTPGPVLLMRYSALTFNGHRIHYDRAYAMDEEGYPGLVVQGPLIATLLMEALRRAHPRKTVRSFAFKAVSPLFDTAPFAVGGTLESGTARLWASGPAGQLAMRASARIE